jgi:hypothetical protein
MLEKLLSRTELQMALVVLGLIVANHTLGWGMSIQEVFAMAGVSAGYGVSRGLAKTETSVPAPAPTTPAPAPAPAPAESDEG